MAVLSQDIKERIVRSVMDDGLSQAETAQRLSVAESTVSRTMRAYRERGTVAPREYVRGPSPRLGDEHLEWHHPPNAPQPRYVGRDKTALAAPRFTEELRAARQALFS